MRLLPVRADHAGGGAAEREASADTPGDRRLHVAEHLPLRDVCAHRACDRARGEGVRMKTTPTLRSPSQGRRRFMLGAGGLTFGIVAGVPILGSPADAATAAKQTVISPWVTLSTDGTVYIMTPATEMGQGSLTSIPL